MHDKAHFYTYSREHLSLAFPMVNENQVAYKEKLASEARWKTKAGFDNKDKKSNLNGHPKKPHPSIIDDLRHSYHEQRND